MLSLILGAAALAQPNIIWIMTDQQTASAMSCAGSSDVRTPNMDRLAAHGVRFTNAYCAMPLSGPSRASMITGLLPCESGMLENEQPLLPELRENTIGDVVRSAGYDCVYAGKWHVNTISLPSQRAFGFDMISPVEKPDEYMKGGNPVTDACVEYLRAPHDRPFFMVASYINPHNICEFARGQRTPHASISAPASLSQCPELPPNYALRGDEPSILAHERSLSYAMYPTVDFNDEDWRMYLYAYYRLVESVDEQIGRIVDEIDRQGLWNNTVVLFMSDHGDGAAAHHWNQKTALWEEVANVPFILCVPGDRKKGTVSDALVNAGIDIMPTLASVSGAQMPSGRSGRDIIKGALPHYIVTETNFKQTSGTYGFMVRTARYKYVIYDKGKFREQLFDMVHDRAETDNLVADPRYARTLSEHRRILWEWVEGRDLKEKVRIKKFLMLP